MPRSTLVNRNIVAARGRTSAMRVYILRYFRTAATEAGHEAAGHGTKPGSAAATYFAEPGLHSLAAAPDA